MVGFTPPSTPPLLIGLKIHPEHPLKFDFLLDRGDVKELAGDELKNESTRLIKYFLAALTVPAKDVWVNLSPYEKDRIVSPEFGLTEMGRDLLGQDYLLKQLMASLTYPEEGLGKTFWDRVYKEAFELYGTTNIPLNTFNKVWIIPDSAEIFEKNGTAFIVNSHLKVMLEEDYLALKENMTNKRIGTDKLEGEKVKQISNVSSGVVKEVLLPEIEKEVNEGKNFAPLRQIYHSLILAIWYKKRLKDSLLGQVYVDKGKVKGIDLDDPNIKEKIYQQYIEAFKQGVYNYIKEDYDPYMQKNIPRKYFSGGFEVPQEFEDNGLKTKSDPASLTSVGQDHLRNNVVGKLETGELESIEIQVAELNEPGVFLKTEQAIEEIAYWIKNNQILNVPFTIDEVVAKLRAQGKSADPDLVLNALKFLNQRAAAIPETDGRWKLVEGLAGDNTAFRLRTKPPQDVKLQKSRDKNEPEFEIKILSTTQTPDEEVIEGLRKRLNAPVANGTNWIRITATPQEAYEFHRNWSSTTPGQYVVNFSGKIYVIPIRVWEKMAAWFGGSRDFERKGYFVAEQQKGEHIKILDFIPLDSAALDPTTGQVNFDPQTTQQSFGIDVYFSNENIAKAFGIDFNLRKELNFNKLFGDWGGLITISAHSHPVTSFYPQGPSGTDQSHQSNSHEFVYGIKLGNGYFFNNHEVMKVEQVNQEVDLGNEGAHGDNIGVALREEKSAEIKISSEVGGIDLTTIEPTLQIKRDEKGVPLPLPLQNIQNIHLDGLKFIILNTAPASFNDFPFLIGLKGRKD